MQNLDDSSQCEGLEKISDQGWENLHVDPRRFTQVGDFVKLSLKNI
jgi:hypothetical protein